MIPFLVRWLAVGVWCTLASAALAVKPLAPSLPGHYYLGKSSEFGAELVLQPDGTFQLLHVFGSENDYARGTWRAAGDTVTLATYQGINPQFRPLTAKELQLPPVKPGRWIAWFGLPGSGGLANVEVTFVASSGASANAVSLRNGDAGVNMPEPEGWARVGVRFKGDPADYQWFAVTPESAAQLIVAFTPNDPEWLGNRVFKTLVMRVVADGLTANSPHTGESIGVYKKRATD